MKAYLARSCLCDCAQAAVLLSAGSKGHRYTFPHAKISTAPPILNRVFGQTVDAQLQVRFGYSLCRSFQIVAAFLGEAAMFTCYTGWFMHLNPLNSSAAACSRRCLYCASFER